MPVWIHNRAKHIMAKNPSMPEGEAFALATQQSHAVGKSPKGYGTSEGRAEAKKKYDTPKDDKKTADPGGIGEKLADTGFGSMRTMGLPSSYMPQSMKPKNTAPPAAVPKIQGPGLLGKAKQTVGTIGKALNTPIPGTPTMGQIGQNISTGMAKATKGVGNVASNFAGNLSHVTGNLPAGHGANLGHFGEAGVRTALGALPATMQNNPLVQKGGNLLGKAVNFGMNALAPKMASAEWVKMAAFYDELEKLGAISDEDARRSLDRLDALEKNKPTMGQMGRYAGLGAMAGPAIGAASNIIKGRPILPPEVKGLLPAVRYFAGDAVGGALGAGAVPLLRNQLDRSAEMGNLQDYIAEREKEEAGPLTTMSPGMPPTMGSVKAAGIGEVLNTPIPHTPAAPPALKAVGSAISSRLGKLFGGGAPALPPQMSHEDFLKRRMTGFKGTKVAFSTNEYSGPMNPGSFQQESGLPPFKKPSLASPIEKKAVSEGWIMSRVRGGADDLVRQNVGGEIPLQEQAQVELPTVKDRGRKKGLPPGPLPQFLQTGPMPQDRLEQFAQKMRDRARGAEQGNIDRFYADPMHNDLVTGGGVPNKRTFAANAADFLREQYLQPLEEHVRNPSPTSEFARMVPLIGAQREISNKASQEHRDMTSGLLNVAEEKAKVEHAARQAAFDKELADTHEKHVQWLKRFNEEKAVKPRRPQRVSTSGSVHAPPTVSTVSSVAHDVKRTPSALRKKAPYIAASAALGLGIGAYKVHKQRQENHNVKQASPMPVDQNMDNKKYGPMNAEQPLMPADAAHLQDVNTVDMPKQGMFSPARALAQSGMKAMTPGAGAGGAVGRIKGSIANMAPKMPGMGRHLAGAESPKTPLSNQTT